MPILSERLGLLQSPCQLGDPIIIVAKMAIPPTALTTVRPRVAVFDEKNRIIDRLDYRVSRNRRGRLHFATGRRQR